MTNKKAISILAIAVEMAKGRCFVTDEAISDAYAMAISALQAQDSPKPKAESVQNVQNEDLISRKAAIDAECEVCQIAPKKERGHNCTYYVHGCKEIECLRALPSAQPEIVHCRDCMHYGSYYRGNESKPVITHLCKWCLDRTMEPDDYCSHAERRTDA